MIVKIAWAGSTIPFYSQWETEVCRKQVTFPNDKWPVWDGKPDHAIAGVVSLYLPSGS